MVISSGIIIFLGFLFLAVKLPPSVSLRLLAYPLSIDLAASVLAYVLHYGSFTGMMAAAVAGLMTSAMTTIGRHVFGYIDSKGYHPGYLDLEAKDE